MHVGESSKMKGGRQGTLSDSRYPPLSKNSRSDFRISTTSRLSFVICRPSSLIGIFSSAVKPTHSLFHSSRNGQHGAWSLADNAICNCAGEVAGHPLPAV